MKDVPLIILDVGINGQYGTFFAFRIVFVNRYDPQKTGCLLVIYIAYRIAGHNEYVGTEQECVFHGHLV
jgi:hypothetical protein